MVNSHISTWMRVSLINIVYWVNHSIKSFNCICITNFGSYIAISEQEKNNDTEIGSIPVTNSDLVKWILQYNNEMVLSTQSIHYCVRTNGLLLFAFLYLVMQLHRGLLHIYFTLVTPVPSPENISESVITEKRAEVGQTPFKLYDDSICCLNSTKSFLLCMSYPHPAKRYFLCRTAGTFSPEYPKLRH